MTLSKQIKKLEHYDVHQRSTVERIGAVVLTAATIFSMVAETHDAARLMTKTDVIVNPNFVAVSSEPGEKNEMVRSPIKFDDGLRAAVTTGA